MLMALDDGPSRASDLVDLFSIDKGAVSRQVQALLGPGHDVGEASGDVAHAPTLRAWRPTS